MDINQITLFDLPTIDNVDYSVECFSADSLCSETARKELEKKYLPITEITNKFNRQSVSYQLNKNNSLHSWFKYKEGFSANLVETLLNEMNVKKGGTILDPFLGSGTTSLVAQINGINSIGFDIMPMSSVAIYAKGNITKYNISELYETLLYLQSLHRPQNYINKINSINITFGAFPNDTEFDISFFSEMIGLSKFSEEAKGLARLCLLNSLESVSYTAKDGQYLRWDERSKKVIEANQQRINKGKEPFTTILNKGPLPTVQQALSERLSKAIYDIQYFQKNLSLINNDSKITFKQNSALISLPLLDDNSIDGVITSPPYCNRYDYTRIYALELAYLGMSEKEIRKTRQDLLSCTVESKSKIDSLRDYYFDINKNKDFDKVLSIIDNNTPFNEVLNALSFRNDCGDINNKGVLKMVRGYFEELSFIYYELYRICKKGATVAFVNDNVRYAGEVIPVDYISTELASQIGFTPKKIYTLKQQKGNSSQQMKKFGRVPLRKSITIWEK